jgi:hypothetical protein
MKRRLCKWSLAVVRRAVIEPLVVEDGAAELNCFNASRHQVKRLDVHDNDLKGSNLSDLVPSSFGALGEISEPFVEFELPKFGPPTVNKANSAEAIDLHGRI